MRPSLSISSGVVVLSRPIEGIGLFDLDGRRLARDFRPAPVLEGARTQLAGVGVDGDRRAWIADPAGSAVRAFTPFGLEVARLVDQSRASIDAAGRLGRPWSVAVRGDADGLELLVASRDRHRHALQLFDESGRLVRSLRPAGDSHGRFDGLEGVAFDGRFVYAVEGGGRVHVHRDLEHHFGFEVEGRGTALRAVAPAGNGRLLVLCATAGLLLFDASGRVVAHPVVCGDDEGQLDGPSDLAVERGSTDERRRILIVDREGERVQVFSLAGKCFGSFADL